MQRWRTCNAICWKNSWIMFAKFIISHNFYLFFLYIFYRFIFFIIFVLNISPGRSETRQEEMRRQCLEFWQVPDLPRTAPQRMSPHMRIKSIFDERSLPRDSMYKPVSLHHPSCLEKVVRRPLLWNNKWWGVHYYEIIY